MITNADGIYYRIKRDGKWQNICFTDLTTEERKALKLHEEYGDEQWERVALHLADRPHSFKPRVAKRGRE